MRVYNPLVTIVIPVYNGSNFLKEAIDSALSQTYDLIEVLVINDGSTDYGETEKIANSYGNRIRYIYKTNGGVSSALNVAIKEMNGEWLSWLSHDDLYYSDKIEKQIDFINKCLKENLNLDLQKMVIHTATESIDINGKVIKRPSYMDVQEIEDTEDVIINNIYNYRLSGCSFLLPKECFDLIGNFREDIRTVSDVEYWYRLLFSGYKFFCITDSILVKNRSHGLQVGKIKKDLFNKELNDLYINIATQLNNSPYGTTRNFLLMYYGLKKRNIKDASKYVKKEYLKVHVSKLVYYIVIPLKALYWRTVGIFRAILKYVYQKIYIR